MTTAAQTTLLHAAELLEDEANSLRSAWGEGQDALPLYEGFIITALELRLLAKRINDGQIAVSPAPYVASKVEQQVLGKALFRSAKIPAPTLTKGE